MTKHNIPSSHVSLPAASRSRASRRSSLGGLAIVMAMVLGGCDPIGIDFGITNPNDGLPEALKLGSKSVLAPAAECEDDCEIVDISPGTTATCGLTRDGRLLCAGGRLETGSELTGLRELVLDEGEAGALVPGSGLYHCIEGGERTACWGGTTQAGQAASLQLVGDGASAAVSLHQRCIVTDEGALHCRGEINDEGVFAVEERTPAVSEFQLAESFGCALDTDGSPTCWGEDDAGQLDVPEIDGVSGLSVGASAACVIDGEELLCWGYVGEGREDLSTDERELVCDGDECDERRYPAPGVVQVAVGKESICYLNNDGAVFCLGSNRAGQLGDGSFDSSEEFVRVADLPEAIQLRAGRLTNCVVTTEGAGYCWGDGEFGMLNAEGLERCTSTRDNMDTYPCSASPVRTF